VTPLFHPYLVNGATGDPALYIERLFERRALMFDLGEIPQLAPRKILRLSHVFVSHTHMDHFSGFDRLVRICLGRDVDLQLFGPPGFRDQVMHKLQGYSWNLVHSYTNAFCISAHEYHADGSLHCARFHCHHAFQREPGASRRVEDGVLLDEPFFRIRATHLDHKIPCLAFCLEEKQHINVWKNRLDALGLPTGPWLKALKAAVLDGAPEDTPFVVRWQDAGQQQERRYPLGELKTRLLKIVPGQKIAYVVDAGYSADNVRRIVALASNADLLFMEAAFLQVDAQRAARTHHLTARQAGELGRAAHARRLIPFHFSPRYSGDEARLVAEAEAAFAGTPTPGNPAGVPDADPAR
jgi:ribonuclease Z